MKQIPKLDESEFRTKRIKTVGNTDILVFVLVKPGGIRHYKQVFLEGDLPLHDKIIKYIGEHEEIPFQSWDEKTLGPFYAGNLSDTTVWLQGWENFSEFRNIVEYEYMRRRPIRKMSEIDGVPCPVEGRALDSDEFNHLYMKEENHG